ncbi:MAG: rhodanese-like domain-containing protein [Syntrophobacteraceae bacterium]
MGNDKNPSEVVEVIFPEDLQIYIAGHREGSYQLIDVRQPEEYEQSHLPGSRLIPLPMLADSLEQLDRARDLIIYCSVGGRSRMAAQFLARRGFHRVLHLQGGIEAWEHRTAATPPELHLQFIRGDESALEAATIACRFEAGLEQFYRAAFDRSTLAGVRDLLEKLLKAEQTHKHNLVRLLESLGAGPEAPCVPDNLMEGGLKIDDFLARNDYYLQSAQDCLELAMMIEIQALDLYLRMAQTCADAPAKGLFHRLGEDEKAHLNWLADLSAKIGRG